MEYAIEMHEGPRYSMVHKAGCKDLRDPQRIGTDWKAGVSDLGTDWEMDVQEGAVDLAPCTKH
jgi:hypothetical protein